jgi:hypothetical protein
MSLYRLRIEEIKGAEVVNQPLSILIPSILVELDIFDHLIGDRSNCSMNGLCSSFARL